MRRLRRALLVSGIILFGLGSSVVHAEPDEALVFGIFPYVSPVQMVEFHSPLRAYLEQQLQRPVSLVTAPSFEEFVNRTRQGRYDIILTAPHLGRLAEVRDGYRGMVHTLHEVQGIYLVHKDSAILRLEDLEGKHITLVGRAAIITQMVEHQLRNLGLEDGRNVHFRFTRTHNNAMYAPLRGESEASVTGTLLWQKIGDRDREQMRVIGVTPSVPGFLLMAGSRISEAQRRQLTTAMLAFADTEAGRDYVNITGFNAFDLIKEGEMQALDPYIQYFLNNP
jgi:phosphonate transport system substrate-binding protein